MKKKFLVLKNNIYMLRIISKADRFRLPLDVLQATLTSFEGWFLTVYLIKLIIDTLTNTFNVHETLKWILVAVGFKLFKIVFDQVYNYYINISNEKVIKRFQNMIFEKAANVDIGCFDNPEFYNNYIFANSESTNRPLEILNSILSFYQTILNVSFSGVFVILGDPFLFVFSIIPILGDSLLRVKMNKSKLERIEKIIPEQKKIEYVKRISYLKEFAVDIRITNIKHSLIKLYKDSINTIIGAYKDFSNRFTILYFFSEGLYHINNCLIIIYLVYKIVVVKTLTIGDFVAMKEAVSMISSNLGKVMERFLKFHENSLYIDKFKKFYEYKNQVVDGDSNIPEQQYPAITLSNVQFAYEEGQMVLKDINLSIKPKEKIAIVGLNGAGKSTLLKLIMRLYDPSNGKIDFCGHDICGFKLDQYRNLFSCVFQDYNCYAFSFHDNIHLNNAQEVFDKKKTRYILEQLDLIRFYDDTIDKTLTKEFDDSGFVLSGGQMQKIAIARALLSQSPILILDEPSSALDPISENKINKLISEFGEEKIVIVISHRLSTTKNLDCIYYLEKGNIVESGTHDELMELGGQYYQMFKIQADQYR